MRAPLAPATSREGLTSTATATYTVSAQAVLGSTSVPFRIIKITRDASGTLAVTLSIPGAGSAAVIATHGDPRAYSATLRPGPNRWTYAYAHTTTTAPGRVTVLLTPTAAGRVLLRKTPHAILRITATFKGSGPPPPPQVAHYRL